MAATKSVKRGQGFRPRKGLGQHFLKDAGIIHEIINRARFQESDRVLEIGSGMGALTLPLAKRVGQILAIEKDPILTDILRKKLSSKGIDNVDLINDDVLRLDFSRLSFLSQEKVTIIGNLPYNISSPFLEKLIGNLNLVSKAILMFQFEFARRLIASPESKEYGALTVLVRYYAHLSPLLEVPKEAFYPRPKVGSMVLGIDFGRPHPRKAEDEERFRSVVKGAFAHRRKTLLNSLKGSLLSFSTDEILAALKTCDIDCQRRAETLDIDDFLCLSSALKSLS